MLQCGDVKGVKIRLILPMCLDQVDVPVTETTAEGFQTGPKIYLATVSKLAESDSTASVAFPIGSILSMHLDIKPQSFALETSGTTIWM